MKFKIGDKVVLKKRIAKWHLDTPEVYAAPNGTVDEDYEPETLLNLMCCMGVPVYGKIIRPGTECWYVSFKCANIKAAFYIDSKDIKRA